MLLALRSLYEESGTTATVAMSAPSPVVTVVTAAAMAVSVAMSAAAPSMAVATGATAPTTIAASGAPHAVAVATGAAAPASVSLASVAPALAAEATCSASAGVACASTAPSLSVATGASTALSVAVVGHGAELACVTGAATAVSITATCAAPTLRAYPPLYTPGPRVLVVEREARAVSVASESRVVAVAHAWRAAAVANARRLVTITPTLRTVRMASSLDLFLDDKLPQFAATIAIGGDAPNLVDATAVLLLKSPDGATTLERSLSITAPVSTSGEVTYDWTDADVEALSEGQWPYDIVVTLGSGKPLTFPSPGVPAFLNVYARRTA